MKNQDYTSHRTLHTSQKGITLIALIITVIVMLILVGVTINVALNGGLFQKASEASEQMQIEAEKEELLSAVVAAIGTDAKVDFNYLDNNLPTGWSKVTDKTYKSLKENIYEVDDYGKITYTGENSGAGNIPEEFKWSKFNLTVDTSADYVFKASEDFVLVMNFSNDGILTVKNRNTNELIITLDATKEQAGVLRLENNDGTYSSLTMHNETDVLATPDDGDPVVYAKIKPEEFEEMNYLFYQISDDGKMIFINRETNQGTLFVGSEDMYFPLPLTEFKIRDIFEYEGETHYNVITAIGNGTEEQYWGEIINDELDAKIIIEDSDEMQIVNTQKLPIESKNIIEIYETQDSPITVATDFTINKNVFYGLLDNGKCYHLFEMYGHYFIVSNGTVDYTIENGILRVEQVYKTEPTGEFKEYTIGTEAIKVK